MPTFGPFKRFYNRACDAWMTSFPDQQLTIYYTAELAVKGFLSGKHRVFIQKDWDLSINPDIFTEDIFLPAAVTDNNAVSMLAEQPTSSTSDDGLQDISILTTIAPYPKATPKPVRCKTREQKSSVITNTVNKLKRFPHLAENLSESEEEEIILESDEPELR